MIDRAASPHFDPRPRASEADRPTVQSGAVPYLAWMYACFTHAFGKFGEQSEPAFEFDARQAPLTLRYTVQLPGVELTWLVIYIGPRPIGLVRSHGRRQKRSKERGRGEKIGLFSNTSKPRCTVPCVTGHWDAHLVVECGGAAKIQYAVEKPQRLSDWIGHQFSLCQL